MCLTRSFLTLLLLIQADLLWASEDFVSDKNDTGLGVGISVVRFDATYKFTNLSSGRFVFVDAEGTLDLPEADVVPVLYGGYRFNDNHAIGFSYFDVNRESSVINIDETAGDIRITGNAYFIDETSYLNLFYSYTLFEDNRSRVLGAVGINWLDIRYRVDAEGTITLPDTSTVGNYNEEEDITAPLPLFGFEFWHAFTPKWGLNTKVAFIAGNFDDITAWVVNSSINTRYNFNKTFGVVFGITYFDADIKIEEERERTDISYGFDGLFLGLHAVF